MKRKTFITIAGISLFVLLIIGAAMAAPPYKATALVLVNSNSADYADFQHFIQPYLDNFGIPYTKLDIAMTAVGTDVSDYSVIIIGHRQLDTWTTHYLDTTEQTNITIAVNNGTGLVNFDNDLSENGSTGRYNFVQDIFSFGYGGDTSGSNVNFADPQGHYITQRKQDGETITTGNMTLAGITLSESVEAIATTGTQPFLAVTTYGTGRAVQWSSYDWMSHSIKGPLFGLDDLVWRSIVWAAHKPFVMQGLPPFVTMRMDDVSGPLWWIHNANDYGFIPWAGIFTNDFDDSEAADLSNIVNSGKATATIHAFGSSNFFYFDHYGGSNYSDATMADHYATATAWFNSHNIPISKYLVPHYYEIGSNAFSGLANWGTEFLGTMMDPGQLESSAPWMMKGPFRLYETGPAHDRSHNIYYADYMTIPSHPEMDSKFFNCVTEIRDVTGYEWLGNGHNSLPVAIQDGTEWLKRALDSMDLATLFSHEYTFIGSMSPANWQTVMQGITQNIAGYNPIYVSMDYACQYVRAMYTSNITASSYDPATQQIATTLGGKTDMPTKFYLFTDGGGGIQQTLIDVPQFNGSTQVLYIVPGPLDHIAVSPNPATIVAGATQQFTALGYDVDNNPIPNLTYGWAVVNGGGTINSSGLFTAGITMGTYTNTVTASYGSIAGYATVQVIPTTIDHFTFQPISSPQYAGVPFLLTIEARAANENIVITYNGQAILSDTTATINPTTTGNFVNGVWTGYVTISQTANMATITATDNAITGTSNNFDVVSMPQCPCSIWPDSATPQNPNVNDSRPIEVGVKFRSDVDGYVLGLRFYKGNLNTGTHVGHLWSANGTKQAEATFTNETVSGWQAVMFDTPVAITSYTTYVASYFSASGGFSDSPDYFTSTINNPPLHALSNGEDGPNGIYRYDTSGFPTNYWAGHSPNYWVDIIFDTSIGPDTTPPTVTSALPVNGATGVSTSTNVSATFSEAMDPATISNSTFELRDTSNALVASTVTYNASARTATLDPNITLADTTTYTATVKGETSGVADLAGNHLSSDFTWTFTTSAPPPDEGPGGPILVIASSSNPFTRYYAEILRTEGLNYFTVTDISLVDANVLADYDVVILGEMSLSSAQVTMLSDWVNAGGNLIAMRPDKQLAGLLGLSDAGSTLSNAYLLVNTASAPGAGIVSETIQYHGVADQYNLNGATALATLYSNATTATAYPAVTLRSVGSNGGQAAAFTYDLARSVVYTRQGNPAWAGDERDGVGPLRADDMFYGAKSGDVQPDWIDLNKVAIPQADEQQRLLANMILDMNLDKKPLPRFWYFPRGLKAAVIMTGDQHSCCGGTRTRFQIYVNQSPPGCSLEDWECIRGSSYVFISSDMTNAEALSWTNQGFELGMHLNTGCANWTPSSLHSMFDSQLASFDAQLPSLPRQASHRTHCIAWSNWATKAAEEQAHGIRLDVNYYFWPPAWVQNRPGMFTGSGMPMRFAALDGTMIDCYQAVTQMTDESGQSYPYTIDTLLDRALGPEGYYGAFTANMHTDSGSHTGSDAIVNSAQARGVPVISGRQMAEWLDGRNGSSFGDISLNGTVLSFTVTVGSGARNLMAMVPTESAKGPLMGITHAGNPVTYATETIKGVEYALFLSDAGNYEAHYAIIDTTPPTGTIAINSGASYTKSTSVTLTLSCTDTESGCSQMRFSNNNITWSTPEAYAITKAWTLTSGDGTKTVYVKFKDNSDNWSTVYSDTIILDTAAPTTTASPPGGTYNSSKSVSLTCNDGSGSGCDKIYYTTDGSTPTTSSPVYSSQINISTTTTLKFFATDLAGNQESVKTEQYTITPTIECSFLPDSSSIPRGGNLGIQMSVTNNTAQSQTFLFVTFVTTPGGNKYPTSGWLVGPISVTLGGNASRSGHKSYNIPIGATLGTYIYHGYVGNYGVGIYHECTFEFTVTAP